MGKKGQIKYPEVNYNCIGKMFLAASLSKLYLKKYIFFF